MEKEKDIATAGSQLLHLLEISETQGPVTDDPGLEKLKGAGASMSVKLSNVRLIKRFSTDGFGNKTAAFVNFPGSCVGISEKNYPKLQEVALMCTELKSVNDRADFNFVEEKIFDWLIECYSNKTIKQNLQDYLENEINIETKEYIFYFKILALGIENGFNFGGVEITHLSEDKIQGSLISFEKTTGGSKGEIDSFFDEFREPVLAISKSFGVKSKALKEARNRVGLAISALKIFFLAESLSLADQMFDVDFRFNQIDSSVFIYESTDPNFDFEHSIHRTQGARPISITKLKLEEFGKRGLGKLSHFILNPKKGSLYIEITDGIDHLGKILSNRILHDRVVELISFFERFVIPKESSRGFGQTRLRDNVLPKIESPGKNLDHFVQLVNQFYNTRDRYIHNRVELPVDLNNLFSFQRLAILFLNHLINLNGKYSELTEVHEYFGIRQG